jgi:hypothetical protein
VDRLLGDNNSTPCVHVSESTVSLPARPVCRSAPASPRHNADGQDHLLK